MTTSGTTHLREFRLLWISGLFAALGAQLSLLALPLLVLRETGSAVRAGAIGTVSVAAVLVTMLPGGFLADSTERLRLLRLCTGGSVVVVAGLTAAATTGRTPYVLILLVAGANAVINSVSSPAALGLLRAVVPAAELGRASSRMQARSAAARLTGPLVGGAIFAWHPAAPFAVEAVCLLLALGCLLLVRTRSLPLPRTGKVRGQITAGLRFLWRDSYLRTVLLVFGLGMNAAFAGLTFAALAVASGGGQHGLSGGLVVSLSAAGSLAGALLAPVLHPERRSALLISATCWVCTAAAAVLWFAHPPLLIALCLAACTMIAGIGSIGFLTTLLQMTPEALVGRVQSGAGFLSSLAQPLGPVVAGLLLGAYGAGTTFALLGAVFAACALTVTPALLGRHRSEPATPAPVPALD